MKTIQISSKADKDAVLHLDIPVEVADAEYDVLVVCQPKQQTWPPGWIDQMAGSIQDETFFRHPQGEYEKRLDLE